MAVDAINHNDETADASRTTQAKLAKASTAEPRMQHTPIDLFNYVDNKLLKCHAMGFKLSVNYGLLVHILNYLPESDLGGAEEHAFVLQAITRESVHHRLEASLYWTIQEQRTQTH